MFRLKLEDSLWAILSGLDLQRALTPTFFWLLNNDTEPPADTLRKMLRMAEASPQGWNCRLGTSGFERRDIVSMWGGGTMAEFGQVSTFTQSTALRETSFLTFASVLLTSAMLRETGLPNESFFMYYEDSSFALEQNVQVGHWSWPLTQRFRTGREWRRRHMA